MVPGPRSRGPWSRGPRSRGPLVSWSSDPVVPGLVVRWSQPGVMADEETSSSEVKVYIYDLTSGLAQTLSQALLGKCMSRRHMHRGVILRVLLVEFNEMCAYWFVGLMMSCERKFTQYILNLYIFYLRGKGHLNCDFSTEICAL